MNMNTVSVESNITVAEDNVKKAESMKEEANDFFKSGDYQKAIELYSSAIDLNPNAAHLYGNRSLAYLKIECCGFSLNDATKAIEIDENYTKGYYRRAAAHMCLGRFKDALKDFEAVLKANPNSPSALSKYKECRKIVNRLAFENAIAVDNARSVAATIDVESMIIEDDYNGPRLEEGKITLGFMRCLIEAYKNQQKLHKKFAYKILLDVQQHLMTLPSLVDVMVADQEKITICGDIHGQFYDLINIFCINGLPSTTNLYLFNGDFVDRGAFSVECIFVLFGFKLLCPDHFLLARGNHESQTMNQIYGFQSEVKAKYSSQMADLFDEVFNWLPLAHCLNGKVLVMHGGLFSRDGVTLDELRAIDRNKQPPDSGLMCELLWSDPKPTEGRAPSKRGIGVEFGPDVTQEFLMNNKLEYIIRSHQVMPEGYDIAHDGKCITVFSAPNYCDTTGNKGAFLTLNGKDLKPQFQTFLAVPHPDVKPFNCGNSLIDLPFFMS